MTTNLPETLNRVLKGVRALPITAFLAMTFYKLNSYFLHRREDGETITSTLAPNIRSKITTSMETARGHIVHQFRLVEFEGNTGDFHYKVVVNGIDVECDCDDQLTGIPCTHLLAVCSTSQKRIDYYNFCFYWYSVDCYHETYAPHFHPVPDRQHWPRPQGLPIVPPLMRRKKVAHDLYILVI